MGQIQLPSGQWYDRFVETLETRGATPQQVSDAVATVHSHCLEANRPPELAFGDPREYALQVGPQQPRLARGWTHLAMSSFLAVSWLAPAGIKHLVNGAPASAGTSPGWRHRPRLGPRIRADQQLHQKHGVLDGPHPDRLLHGHALVDLPLLSRWRP